MDPGRIKRLLDEKRLDREKADRFLAGGALGSHLELIQRGEGFKGFNQQTISDIISRTDPRRQE